MARSVPLQGALMLLLPLLRLLPLQTGVAHRAAAAARALHYKHCSFASLQALQALQALQCDALHQGVHSRAGSDKNKAGLPCLETCPNHHTQS